MTPFGIKLKYIRLQRHKSLKDLSKALKVSIAYVSMLENGKRGRPADGLIELIISVGGIKLEDYMITDTLRKRVVKTQPKSQDFLRKHMTRNTIFCDLMPRFPRMQASRWITQLDSSQHQATQRSE